MLFQSAWAIAIAGMLMACGAQQDVRRTNNKELISLYGQGRKVHQPARMSEAYGFGLIDTETAVFRVDRGHDDSVPSLIQFDTSKSPALPAEAAADFSAAWFEEHGNALGLAPNDLRPEEPFGIYVTDAVYMLRYTRLFQGIPVRDTRIEMSFAVASDGSLRLREVLNRGHGVIRLENPEAPSATLDQVTQALADVDVTPRSIQPVIYPIEDQNETIRMILGSEVQAWDEAEQVNATITFANGDLTPVEAYRHRYADRVRIEASVYGRNYLDVTRAGFPMSFTMPSGAATPTDADGYYEANLAEGAQVTLPLTSSRVTTVNAGSTTPLAVTGSYSAQSKKIMVNPSAEEIIGVNAHLSVQRINAFVRRHLRENELPLLNRSIRVTTNVAGSCNAFYDGQISLYAAGQGCANMGLVNDVTYHEWGHGLDDAMGGITDGAFSEGIGDILAGYYTNNSSMAPGFIQGNSQGIRELANNFRFPDNRGGVHQEGLTIGGSFWDLRTALIERYGAIRGAFTAERLFFRHLAVSNSYRASYQDVLTVDDDDGNPMTPSPNRCLITTAFAKHGLATEDPACKDVDPAFAAVRMEPSLSVTVLSSVADGARLAGAGPLNARNMFACIGSEIDCVKAQRQDLTFTLDGTKGDKVLFVADKAVSLQEQQNIVLFVKDQAGTLLGKRSFFVHSK